MIGGGALMLTSSATHWVDWISAAVSFALGLLGLVSVLYGLYSQRRQRQENERREARDIELHRLKVAELRRRLDDPE
jgi:hypothetical protein